ncbi:MAG: hypothetical protein N2204_05600, partial [Anaerolineae bacterium]|nr:hypothetical protein [Anaerolineae bacterium]
FNSTLHEDRMRTVARTFLLPVVAFLVLTAGCVPISTEISPLPTPVVESVEATAEPTPTRFSVPTPAPDVASVVGRVVAADTKSPQTLTGMPVRLARVFWNEDRSDGAFVLEGATSPSALIQEDGFFFFQNVVPADYVIVVGDPFGQNAIITEPDGKARVITLEAGKTLDVGKLEVTLKSP